MDNQLVRGALALVLAVSGLAACSAKERAPVVAKVGAAAPAFEMPTADGHTLASASLKGKGVYLNFFATWCPPCNEEAPDVNALAKQYAPRGLQVVGVDVLENQKKAKSFVDLHHLVYPAVVDDGTLRDAYRINGMPVHVFIDPRGIVRKIETGELTKAQMESGIRAVLPSEHP